MAANKTEEVEVVFLPSGKRGRFPKGHNLLDAARNLKVDIDSICGGRGICGRCQISPSFGKFAKLAIESDPSALSPVSQAEARYAEKRGLKSDRRLSCQTKLEGDLVVDVPPESQVHRQLVRKSADARPIEIDPPLRLHYIKVEPAGMEHPSGDLERLRQALSSQWQLEDLEVPFSLLKDLQKTLRKEDWSVTAVVYEEKRLVALFPGFREKLYGLAVDLGSTTIAAQLCDLATGELLAQEGQMNPQIRFGEDLMSRVSYVMMNEGSEAELSRVVREAISNLALACCKEVGLTPEGLLSFVVVGNPVMLHLFLGLDPSELGGAPFALTVQEGRSQSAGDLELGGINPAAPVYTLPCIAGHVGADAAAVILSEAPDQSDEVTLIVDIGTNAEIILGNKDRLLAASSPTGPAFEGAQISSGQRAAFGAIERVRIDRESLAPRFRVIGSDLWSNEAGFQESLGPDGVTGVCGSGIIEAVGELYASGLIHTDGLFNEARLEDSGRLRKGGRTAAYLLLEEEKNRSALTITQNDIRAIQLAKAALHAGVKLLMERYGVDRPDRIKLAGAFGSHIDALYALIIGLLPDASSTQVRAVGNAAGTGARIALLNRKARRDIERLVRSIEKVETALESRFQEYFVDAMAFPHATDPYNHLRAEVKIPAFRVRGEDSKTRARRNRPRSKP